MATQTERQQGTTQISVEELAEAAVRGAQRALAARLPGGKGEPFPGPITVGVVIEPPPTDGRPPDQPPVDEPDLIPLRTGAPLSRAAAGQVADRLSKSREQARALAQSFRRDFAGTLDQLFELSADQYVTLKAVSREHRSSLDHLARVLEAAFSSDDDLAVNLDIAETTAAKKKDEKEDKNGIDWEIKIEAKCETDKDCSAGASLTIKF